MMERRKQGFGFLAGLAVCAIVWFLPIDGLPEAGRRCLAMSLTAVVWWATGAMHPGFASAALLLGYCLLLPADVVPGSLVFQLWTTPTMYLVIGGFLSFVGRESGWPIVTAVPTSLSSRRRPTRSAMWWSRRWPAAGR